MLRKRAKWKGVMGAEWKWGYKQVCAMWRFEEIVVGRWSDQGFFFRSDFDFAPVTPSSAWRSRSAESTRSMPPWICSSRPGGQNRQRCFLSAKLSLVALTSRFLPPPARDLFSPISSTSPRAILPFTQRQNPPICFHHLHTPLRLATYRGLSSQTWAVCTIMVKGFPVVLSLTFVPHQRGLKLNPKQWKKKSSNLYVHPSLPSSRHFWLSAFFTTPPYLAHLASSALPTHPINPPHLTCLQTTAPQPHPRQQARKGFFPSQIGLVLRDSQAVAQVQAVTGSKILRILKAGGLGPRLPEDLYHMIKKAVTIRKHLSLYRKDKDAKFRLILVESRIHRLARYYRSKRQLPPNWRYDSSNASTLVA